MMKENRIYIPLCFYFIGGNWNLDRSEYSIYIPLCFYFIKNYGLWNAGYYEFTFHYASTLSSTTRNSPI